MKRCLLMLALLSSACAAADTSYSYVSCATDGDCTGRARCQAIVWRDGNGHLCTATCSGESSCPHAGRCLDVTMTGTFFCYEPCGMDSDCPTSFVCQPVTTGGSVCLPGP